MINQKGYILEPCPEVVINILLTLLSIVYISSNIVITYSFALDFTHIAPTQSGVFECVYLVGVPQSDCAA